MINILLIAAHVLIASATSCHILLNKRDVRSAIGWLGVTWLSPLIGATVYFLFGINRVARSASKLRGRNGMLGEARQNSRGHTPARETANGGNRIVQVGNAVSNHPIVGGNKLEILENGDTAYPAMISSIEGASQTIALSSYIFRMDASGTRFVQALDAAKKRGVEIKVLVDGIGGGFFRCPVTTSLVEKNIEAHRFLPGSALHRIPYLNLRNHKKILIVDGVTGFVGGMNLGGENLFRRNSEQSVRDCHFRFTGPVVEQLLQSFEEDWHFTTGQVLEGDNWWPAMAKSGKTEARVINSGPDHDLGNVERVFSAAIGSAKHHIRIVTPYFLPEDRVSYLLELAALRGVQIELVLPQKTDFRLFDWALEGQLAAMNLDRMTCLRSTGAFDHSKLITVDGEWCAIGSPNWDARSMRLNFEILVECHDKATVGRINRFIDQKVARSIKHSPHNQPTHMLPIRLRNAAARLLMPYL